MKMQNELSLVNTVDLLQFRRTCTSLDARARARGTAPSTVPGQERCQSEL